MEALDSLRIESVLAEQAERDAPSDETGQADFLRMLVAQLQNQDPLNPQDSADFAAQLAQFSSLEQLIGVREGVDALVKEAAPAAGGRAANVDPTGLIGRDVVVDGSQLEIGAEGGPLSVGFHTLGATRSVTLRLLDAQGEEVYRDSRTFSDGTGVDGLLPPGDYAFELNAGDLGLPPGVYSVELAGQDLLGRSVQVQPKFQGRVNGAILAGEPSIRIGSRVFPVKDVIEVRMPAASQEPGL